MSASGTSQSVPLRRRDKLVCIARTYSLKITVVKMAKLKLAAGARSGRPRLREYLVSAATSMISRRLS